MNLYIFFFLGLDDSVKGIDVELGVLGLSFYVVFLRFGVNYYLLEF